MGIGDKQRIEAERREKYERAVLHAVVTRPVGIGERDYIVDAVLALVDAEIEPLQEQIERDGERIAGQIGRIVGLENEVRSLRAASPRIKAEALLARVTAALMQGGQNHEVRWREAVRVLEEGGALPEPEYEYAIRGKKWHLPSDARFGSLQEVQEWLPRYTRKPEDWVIVRRRKAGEWEDDK